jgi:hypothetical protein
MLRSIRRLALAGGIAASCLAGTGAEAGSIVGLIDGKSIVTIDPATRKVTSSADISGAGRILGIDVRPADGKLYGLGADGQIVTIDVKSGKATPVAKLSETWKAGVATTFDFNPVADRLRLMSSEGTSLRVNVDDGKAIVDGAHRYKDGDPNAGRKPRVVAGAYTNSFKGAKTTTLYNIDADAGVLVTQAPPNDGVLNTVGPLGVSLKEPIAFNIVSVGEDKNDAWLVSDGWLFSVDLKTGKATQVGKIEGLRGNLSDIAWMD